MIFGSNLCGYGSFVIMIIIMIIIIMIIIIIRYTKK